MSSHDEAASAIDAPMGGPRPLWLRALRRLLWVILIFFVAVFVLVRGSAYYFAGQPETAIGIDSADVIIVLSAGLTRDTVEIDPFTTARVEKAVSLWAEGAAPVILMSGGRDLNTGLFLSERMKLYAMELGAPRQAILVEGRSVSTFENARFALDVARQEGWRSAIVVTDDFHLLRAWTLFEFWRLPSDMEVAALAAAEGRQAAGWWASIASFMRETLAVPFNVAKIIGQSALEMVGLGQDRTIR